MMILADIRRLLGMELRIGKNLFRAALLTAGYQLTRADSKSVRYEQFDNLCQAYEQLMSENNSRIKPNVMRSRLLAELRGTPPSEAYYIVEALCETVEIEGDVCEFGVAQGATSALIANEILESKKLLHLFDSFHGLPPPTDKDMLKDDIFGLGSMSAYSGQMSVPISEVIQRLNNLSFPRRRCVIHAGFIEGLLNDDRTLPYKVSFAYVDLDLYEPIKLALEYLDRVMEQCGIIIVDDYDFFSTGAKTAVDEFMSRNAFRYEGVVPNKNYGHFAVIKKIVK
jgi:O-methyltransferase